MTQPAKTAEWHCTRCATVNRKLVAATTDEAGDRCVHCRTKHEITPGTPPTWDAAIP